MRLSVSFVLGLITLAAVALLLFWDAAPGSFPPRAHDLLSALPLALIGLAAIAHRLERRRPTASELARALLLAAAFFCWAANQFWPTLPGATLLNDLAVALFVIDVWWVISARQPAASAAAMKSRTWG